MGLQRPLDTLRHAHRQQLLLVRYALTLRLNIHT